MRDIQVFRNIGVPPISALFAGGVAPSIQRPTPAGAAQYLAPKRSDLSCTETDGLAGDPRSGGAADFNADGERHPAGKSARGDEPCAQGIPDRPCPRSGHRARRGAPGLEEAEPGQAPAAGSSTSKQAPRSAGRLAIVPPQEASSERAMERPRPVPPCSRRPVWKGSNMRSLSAGGHAGAVVGDPDRDPAAAAARRAIATSRGAGLAAVLDQDLQHRLDQLGGRRRRRQVGREVERDREIGAAHRVGDRAQRAFDRRRGIVRRRPPCRRGRGGAAVRAAATAGRRRRRRWRGSGGARPALIVSSWSSSSSSAPLMPAIGVLNSWLTAAAKSRR